MRECDSLTFATGARWSYGTADIPVLGKVIEVLSKQGFFDYVRELLSNPAGMTSTDVYAPDDVNPNLAVGSEKEYGDDGTKRFRNNLFMRVMRAGPADGGRSTAPDFCSSPKRSPPGSSSLLQHFS